MRCRLFFLFIVTLSAVSLSFSCLSYCSLSPSSSPAWQFILHFYCRAFCCSAFLCTPSIFIVCSCYCCCCCCHSYCCLRVISLAPHIAHPSHPSHFGVRLVLGTFTPAPWHSTQQKLCMQNLPHGCSSSPPHVVVVAIIVAILAKLCKIYAIFDIYICWF